MKFIITEAKCQHSYCTPIGQPNLSAINNLF